MNKSMQKQFEDKRVSRQNVVKNDAPKYDAVLILHQLQRLKPSTLAVIVQCAAFMTILALTQLSLIFSGSSFKPGVGLTLVELVMMQSVLASALSYCLNMAVWWRWIHLFFPLAMFAMSRWQLPNEFYFVGFVISLSLFWTTFRSQVPFYPSRPAVWKQVAKLMPIDNQVRLIDIGSGLGDMSMHIAKVRPDCLIEGIEIAPLPWLISSVRAKISRSKATFTLGDYHALNFADYDIIFAYLSPAAMLALWKKASKEMRSGSLLISLEFDIPDVKPSIKIAGTHNSPDIYVWKI